MMQLPLVGFEEYLWPTCAVCHEHKPLLGQYSPRKRWGVCRECSLAHPMPIEAFVVGMRKAESAARVAVVYAEDFVRRRYAVLWPAVCGVKVSKAWVSPYVARQLEMPVCPRCGMPHGRVYTSLGGLVDYETYCQRCEDELAVETLWRLRGIWQGADDEDLLDKFYKRSPELFERGVLPNYWFELKVKEDGRQTSEGTGHHPDGE